MGSASGRGGRSRCRYGGGCWGRGGNWGWRGRRRRGWNWSWGGSGGRRRDRGWGRDRRRGGCRGQDEVGVRRGVGDGGREPGRGRGGVDGAERAGQRGAGQERPSRGCVGSGREGEVDRPGQGRGPARGQQIDRRGRDADDQGSGRGLGVAPVDRQRAAGDATVGEVERARVVERQISDPARDHGIDAVPGEQGGGRIDADGIGREVAGQRELRARVEVDRRPIPSAG